MFKCRNVLYVRYFYFTECKAKLRMKAYRWRPRSVINLCGGSSSLDYRLTRPCLSRSLTEPGGTTAISSRTQNGTKPKISENANTERSTKVTIVLVNAKGLPRPPDDGSAHSIYCKFRLGSGTFKSKLVPYKRQPEWCERFSMRISKDYLLKVSVCEKGKQKNVIGRADIDLSLLQKERTHEIWRQLDGDFGTIHMTVTLCSIHKTSKVIEDKEITDLDELSNKYVWYNLNSQWDSVGQLNVKLIKARGLSGKPNAFCTLELDNERVQTHSTSASSEPTWNKNYVFNVHDITSTFDLKVYDNSLLKPLRNDSVGRVSIPLLRISNGVQRWYALKDKSKKHIAKGNCPRVLLEMTIIWNPIKASLRLFQPKEIKYVKKSPKFDIALVYSNVKFIRDTFNVAYEVNEGFKSLFEWQDQELSLLSVICWCVLCYYIRVWTVPLLLLLPFIYFGFCRRIHKEQIINNESDDDDCDSSQQDHNSGNVTEKIKGLQEMTLTITDGIEFIASIAERLYNLITFKVPFLSFLAMILLIIYSLILYIVPFNYLLMTFGIYKFTRKYLNPTRVLNNDILDFISRVPDNEILKTWKEFSVPEPNNYNY